MFLSPWTTAGLLTALVVLCGETSDIEEQLDTCVWVEVNFDYGHNKSEESCEGPEKPLNGGYVSDVIRERYNTGDTITYHCNTGHQLIGHVNRTCNATSKQWEPQEPYCQPEYIGQLMKRLDGFEGKLNVIEDKVTLIEQRITPVENNTLETKDKISAIDNKMLANDNKSTDIEPRTSSVVTNNSLMESLNSSIPKSRGNLVGCPKVNKAIDQNTVVDCVTIQWGVRDGYSVFESKWVIKDFNSKVSAEGTYSSSPFYHTVPGYKFRLYVYTASNTNIDIRLYLLPGEYDDQLIWPVSLRYDRTVLTNDGSEVLHYSQSGTCSEKRPTSATITSCHTLDSNWVAVWTNKKHILNDGSVVFKLYLHT